MVGGRIWAVGSGSIVPTARGVAALAIVDGMIDYAKRGDCAGSFHDAGLEKGLAYLSRACGGILWHGCF